MRKKSMIDKINQGAAKPAVFLTLFLFGLVVRPLPAQAPPGNYVLERVEDKPVRQTSHLIFPNWPLDALAEPLRGIPFVQFETGHRITRISDVADIAAQLDPGYPYDGHPGRGLTNGYAKYSNANVTGQYVIAFGVQPWINALYRVDGNSVNYLGPVRHNGNGLGESYDIRWDLSGEPGTETTIYYHYGTRIYKQDVLVGSSSDEEIFDFGVNVYHEGHMSQSRDARYRPVRLYNDTTVVLDMKNKEVLPGTLGRGMCDLSPEGKWLLFDGYRPSRLYRVTDLASNNLNSYVELPTRSHGHDGWAYDYRGDEVYVYQDNQRDTLNTFNPETGEVIVMLHMSETGWGLNQHIARISNPQLKGWVLVSTYGHDNSEWSYNQFFMLEIMPKELHPRIWRLASTHNKWRLGSKIDSYFAESFASIDFAGRNVYWGANWRGNDLLGDFVEGGENLELYRLELPENWWQTLSANVEPPPLPTPTATPTPSPEPTPTPEPGQLERVIGPQLRLDDADTLHAPVGAWVTIWGFGFGDEQHNSGVYIGSVRMPIRTWSAERIVFRVAEGAYSHDLRVVVRDTASNPLYFEVTQGNVYYVDPSDFFASDLQEGTAQNPWKTISGAVQPLLRIGGVKPQPGDIVYIRGGTYYQNVVPTVDGTAEAPILFKAYPGEKVEIEYDPLAVSDQNPLTEGYGIDIDGADYLHFSGLTLLNFNHSLRVRNARGCGFYGLDMGYGDDGVLINGSSGITLAHSEVHEYNSSGVRVTGNASDILLRNVTSRRLTDLAGGGFDVDATVTDLRLERCMAENVFGDGFDLRPPDINIQACAALRNTIGFRISNGATIANSWAHGNVTAAFLLQATGSARYELLNCTASGSIGTNIVAEAGAELWLQNVIAVGSRGPALFVADDPATDTFDALIVQTEAYGGPVIRWGGSEQTYTMDEVNNGTFAAETGQTGLIQTVYSPTLLFQDYFEANLDLNETSPAQQFGIQTAPRLDYLGRPRPETGPVDAGAYEFTLRMAADRAWAMYD